MIRCLVVMLALFLVGCIVHDLGDAYVPSQKYQCIDGKQTWKAREMPDGSVRCFGSDNPNKNSPGNDHIFTRKEPVEEPGK